MQLKCGNIFVVFVNVFTLSESSVILKLSMVSECRREDSEVVQLTLSLNKRQPIMTEAIIFTAASVMQQLWLADAGLAVRRGILGLCVFLQTVLFNLSFSHKLEPKCRLPQRSRAQWKVEGGRWKVAWFVMRWNHELLCDGAPPKTRFSELTCIQGFYIFQWWVGRKAFALSVTLRVFCGLWQYPTGKLKGANIGDNNSVAAERGQGWP